MQKGFRYLILIIFLSSVLLIVFLQFNSGKSINSLIKGNKNLLHELEVQAQLKKLETDIIYIESSIRGLVITKDSFHLQGVTAEIKGIEDQTKNIQHLATDTASAVLFRRLTALVNAKVEHNNSILNAYFTKGKGEAENVINTNRGKVLRDSITRIIDHLLMNRQIRLSGITASINTNGARAKSWGLVLAIIACLSCLVTFWYLVYESQRQKKMIKALDASEKKIMEASRIKEQFVTNISHEIRTPMNAILGFTGLLQKTALDKNQHEFVKAIRSSSENLLAIINDVLDLSRIESGMMHIEYLPFNPRELVDSIVTMLNVKAKKQGLYLRAEVDDNVPKILKGDAVRLTQILMNLISNALKFTHKGGVTVTAGVKEKKDEVMLVSFTITDTGIGIEPEKQKSIFERFQQAEAETTRRYGGTGLGLAIVKQLVNLQNGEITVSSEAGKGSVFTVLLPYQLGQENEKVFDIDFAVSLQEPIVQGMKLLVADDNTMNRQLISHLLQQWEIDFDMVINGIEVVEALRKKPSGYDLVLMDIQMPEMDGYTATEKIRYDLNLTIPIIAMTAHALAGEREKCLGVGMDEYISKPIDEEHLYKLITSYAVKEKSTNGIIDLNYLRTFSKGDKNFEQSMIKAFSEQAPVELSELRKAIGQKDYSRIKAIAHNMKSTVSYMGLHNLNGLLQQIEIEAESGNGLAAIHENFRKIESSCELALREAREMIA
jgi:signal transduction histidine kinase/CheY-like chemotaxis protein